jgi:type II secretory pathway component PulJ
MKRVIKLTERDLSRIVRRVVKEDEESKKELDMETKLDDIFFGNDSLNIFTPAGEFGYLSQEKRLKREVTPMGRKERIQQVIDGLEEYIEYLRNERLGEEDSFIENPDYDEVWNRKDKEVSERHYRKPKRY